MMSDHWWDWSVFALPRLGRRLSQVKLCRFMDTFSKTASNKDKNTNILIEIKLSERDIPYSPCPNNLHKLKEKQTRNTNIRWLTQKNTFHFYIVYKQWHIIKNRRYWGKMGDWKRPSKMLGFSPKLENWNLWITLNPNDRILNLGPSQLILIKTSLSSLCATGTEWSKI